MNVGIREVDARRTHYARLNACEVKLINTGLKPLLELSGSWTLAFTWSNLNARLKELEVGNLRFR